MAQSITRRAGQVLREGPAGAAEAPADVPPLERKRQLPIRPEEEETKARQDRRSR